MAEHFVPYQRQASMRILWYIQKVLAQKINKKKKKKLQKHSKKVRSAAFTNLERVVKEKGLLNDLTYLISFNHTDTLEAYCWWYSNYCPKRLYFLYQGMIACSQLAVLDSNASVGLKRQKLDLENLHLSSSFQKLPNHKLQKILYQKKTKFIITI